MGTWGAGIFASDLAADVRDDWREAILDGSEPEAATAELISRYAEGGAEFWIALAAAQFETGRLQPEVRDRALAEIAAGADLEQWRLEAPGDAKRRERALAKLADALRGPAPKPKRLRRAKPLGVDFAVGDVVLVAQRALVAIVGHSEGWPRGTRDPVIEVLAWEGSQVPDAAVLGTLPILRSAGHHELMRDEGWHPSILSVVTARRDHRFSPEIGEIVAQGVQRPPNGYVDGRSPGRVRWSTTWPHLRHYVEGPLYEEDLRATH